MPKPLNILETESLEEFDNLSATFQAELKPATETERFLVDMIIQHEWLMRRALRMQQTLVASATDQSQVDPKRLGLVIRYYRTHEKSALQAKRELDSIRKHRRKVEKALAEASTREHRHWEQILKKMPTLSSWVN